MWPPNRDTKLIVISNCFRVQKLFFTTPSSFRDRSATDSLLVVTNSAPPMTHNTQPAAPIRHGQTCSSRWAMLDAMFDARCCASDVWRGTFFFSLTLDLKRFSNKDNIKNELELGFIFLMDYNEDRQYVNNGESTQIEGQSFGNRVVRSDHENHASIILNTIGAETFKMIKINILSCRACDIDWWRGV